MFDPIYSETRDGFTLNIVPDPAPDISPMRDYDHAGTLYVWGRETLYGTEEIADPADVECPTCDGTGEVDDGEPAK